MNLKRPQYNMVADICRNLFRKIRNLSEGRRLEGSARTRESPRSCAARAPWGNRRMQNQQAQMCAEGCEGVNF